MAGALGAGGLPLPTFDPATRLAWVSEERVAAELARATSETSYDRQIRRELVALVATCWGWMLLGTSALLWSAHTSSADAATMVWVSAFVIGYGGTYFTIIVYFVRRSERGDFDH